MDILYAAVHQTSRDQEALPRPVSRSGIAPGMKHHSEHKQPWPECMKIAFTSTGHFDPSTYQCHMALATISLALFCLKGKFGLSVGVLSVCAHRPLSTRICLGDSWETWIPPLLQEGRTLSNTPPKDQEATVVCIINHGLHQPEIFGVESQD